MKREGCNIGQSFKETAHLKTDTKKYQENFDSIDWTSIREKKTQPCECYKNEFQVCDECQLGIRDITDCVPTLTKEELPEFIPGYSFGISL